MAWPLTPLGTTVEAWLGPTLGWVDITDDVRLESAASGGGISITWGRSAEGQDAEHTRCNLTLDNRSGKYSPRNPDSPYYGLLGRNTPMRVRVAEAGGAAALAVSGRDPANSDLPGVMSSPANAAYNITGPIDVRLEARVPNGWRPSDVVTLGGKYVASGTDRSWWLQVNRTGQIGFGYTPDGTAASRITLLSGPPVVPGPSDRLAIRVTFVPATGALVFYTAPSIAGPWTQLGGAAGVGATTLPAAPGAGIEIGAETGLSVPSLAGVVYAFELRSGIGGTVVAAPNIAGMQPGDTALTDQFGRTWNLTGQARIIDYSARCYTEASVWPARWDLGDFDRWVPMETSGITRRLQQGASPRRTPLYRTLIKRDPAAYLPLEDGSDSTRPSSAAARVPSGQSTGVTFGSDIAPRGARSAVILDDSTSVVSTPVEVRTSTTWSCLMLIKMNHLPATGQYWPFARYFIEGGAAAWLDLELGDAGLNVMVRDRNNREISSQAFGYGAEVVPTEWFAVTVQIAQNGSNVDWGFVWHAVGGTLHYGTFLMQQYPGAVGRMSRVEARAGSQYDGLALSHLIVDDSELPVLSTEFRRAADGYVGETAGARILRLCTEEGVPCSVYGQPSETEPLGRQPEVPLMDLLRDAAKVDGGILAESRGMLGFTYRTRISMYNQVPLALSYTAGHLTDPFIPQEDDSAIINDATVTRDGGGSARWVQTTGPMSTAPPPSGVGTYDTAETVNIETDDRLLDQSSWRVNLGTVDEHRYTRMTVDLASRPLVSDPALTKQIANQELGDAAEVANLPATLVSGKAGMLLQGRTEKLDAFTWQAEWNASPSSPWQVATVEGPARVAGLGTVLAASITSGAASMQLTSTADNGPWQTDPAHFPMTIKVGEEQITLSSITGTGLTQTGAISARGVNGTTAHAWTAGVPIQVALPARVAL